MRIPAITSLVAAAVIVAACGGSSSTKTPVASPSAAASPAGTEQPTATKAAASTAPATAIPPSATAGAELPTSAAPTQVPAPVATSTPVPQPPPPLPPPPPGGSISIVAKETLFTQASFTAAAGALTVNFDNQDDTVVHNVHFFDATGASVAETDLAPGPVTASVTFNVTPGRYAFKCDVHPQVMHGVLTVS